MAQKYFVGQKVGHLTILKIEHNPIRFICRCDCGKICEKKSAQMSRAALYGQGAHCGCRSEYSLAHRFAFSMNPKAAKRSREINAKIREQQKKP